MIVIVEGQSHLHGEAPHDVLDERLSEGDTVEVLLVVKLLDDFQVGLEGLDLGIKILCDFLDRFITGKEVENLIDVTAKDVNTSELLD